MQKGKSIVYDKAYAFSVQIVYLYKEMCDKREYVLSKQLVKSGTSIGANIAEANGGISKADFSAKMAIAYKEALETKYWLNLLKDTGYISLDKFNKLYSDAEEISKILNAIIKSSRGFQNI